MILLNVLETMPEKGSGLKPPGGYLGDTETVHGNLMLTLMGGLVPRIYQSPQAARNYVA